MPNKLFRFRTLVGHRFHYVVADTASHAALLLGSRQALADPSIKPEWYQEHYLERRGRRELGDTAAMPGVVALYQRDMGVSDA